MFFLILKIILCIIAIFVTLSILILTSTIKIQISDFRFMLPKNIDLNKNCKIIVKLYLFGKIKVLSINIDKTKLEKEIIKNRITNVEEKLKKNKDGFDIEFFNVLKELLKNVIIENLNFSIYFGLDDAALTAISIGAFSGVIGYLLGLLQWNFDKCKTKSFEVIPIYQGRNLLKIDLESIFAIKMWDIIIIIYNLLKKRRVNKDVRTSNRRTYAYSNE